MGSKSDRLKANMPSLRQMTDAMIGEPEVVEREVVIYQDNPNAITRHDDGTMTYKRFTMTAIGLVVPEDVTPDELLDVGRVIHGLQSSIQWIVGDFMNSVNRVWGESYQQVAAELGYEVKTVKEWAHICRKVSIRMDKLTFGHHQIVASYSPEIQQHWLQWAATSGASISALRQAIKEWLNPPKQLELKLKFSDDVIEGEHDSYTHLTRLRNVIKGQQSISPEDALQDAIKLRDFVDKVIRDLGGE